MYPKRETFGYSECGHAIFGIRSLSESRFGGVGNWRARPSVFLSETLFFDRIANFIHIQ
jgi:hypothetical protein